MLAPLLLALSRPAPLLLALGGIRLPAIQVPTSTLSGEGNSGPTFCVLYGSITPFDSATLRALYPTHAAYLARTVVAAAGAVLKGWLLAPDAVEIVRDAARAPIPG